eukprot:scaffold34698_cov16-Tisochrysis_lutea.AAC.1
MSCKAHQGPDWHSASSAAQPHNKNPEDPTHARHASLTRVPKERDSGGELPYAVGEVPYVGEVPMGGSGGSRAGALPRGVAAAGNVAHPGAAAGVDNIGP